MENEINEEKKKLTGIVEESGGGGVGETVCAADWWKIRACACVWENKDWMVILRRNQVLYSLNYLLFF